MYIRFIPKLCFLLSFLTACTMQAIEHEQQPSLAAVVLPTQILASATPSREVIHTSTSTVTQETPQATIQPLLTPVPTQTFTPTPINWGDLPRLSEVILSKDDFVNVDILQVMDATEELGNSCLWDCAKKYYIADRNQHWTVVLLRAGDNQKAYATAQKLKSNFSISYEWTPDDLSNMVDDSWVVEHQGRPISVTTGLSYGNIVILITVSEDWCVLITDTEMWCEGDAAMVASGVSGAAQVQIQKLADAGYQKSVSR